MLTWSFVKPEHAPLSTVHSNTFTPTPRPVTEVLNAVGLVMVPEPETRLQTPLAGAWGLFPFKITEGVDEQITWSGPALAGDKAPSYTVITTWSVVIAPQVPLFTVYSKTFTPVPRPLTVVFGSLGLAMLPLPLVSTHVPVAGKVTALPAKLVVGLSLHKSWLGPAFAAA